MSSRCHLIRCHFGLGLLCFPSLLLCALCAPPSDLLLLCIMAGSTHAAMRPIDVEGSLMAADRDDIFAATGCSVATRDRGQGRKLTVAGPVSGLEEARRLALEACARNQDHWLRHGQSANPGRHNEPGLDARLWASSRHQREAQWALHPPQQRGRGRGSWGPYSRGGRGRGRESRDAAGPSRPQAASSSGGVAGPPQRSEPLVLVSAPAAARDTSAAAGPAAAASPAPPSRSPSPSSRSSSTPPVDERPLVEVFSIGQRNIPGECSGWG